MKRLIIIRKFFVFLVLVSTFFSNVVPAAAIGIFSPSAGSFTAPSKQAIPFTVSAPGRLQTPLTRSPKPTFFGAASSELPLLPIVTTVPAKVVEIPTTVSVPVRSNVATVLSTANNVTDSNGGRWVEKIIDVVFDTTEKVIKTGERWVDKVVEVVHEVPRTIIETGTRLIEKTVPIVRQVVEYVKTFVEEAYAYPVQVVRNVVETVIENVREAYEVVKQVPRQITEWVNQQVAVTKQIARTVYDRVTNYVTQWIQETVPVVRQVARTVWDAVTSWVPKQVSSWLGKFWGYVTQLVQQITHVARTVYDTITDYVTRTVARVVPVITSVARTVYDTVTEWVNRAVSVVKTVYDTVRETAYRWVQKPVQVVRQVVDTVWQTGKRLVEKIVPVVRQVTDYVTQKSEEAYRVVKTVYDTVKETVIQKVKEVYEYVVEVPKQVVKKIKVLMPDASFHMGDGSTVDVHSSIYYTGAITDESSLKAIINTPSISPIGYVAFTAGTAEGVLTPAWPALPAIGGAELAGAAAKVGLRALPIIGIIVGVFWPECAGCGEPVPQDVSLSQDQALPKVQPKSVSVDATATPQPPNKSGDDCGQTSVKRVLNKPKADDQILQKNYIDKLFQPTDKIPGGTAGAIREELATGNQVGNKFHSLKGKAYLKGLKNWLNNNPKARLSDQEVVNDLINDIEDALCNK
ncbi:MAG: hypothetical protein EXS55_00015 [Candidatus Magasanikbacteria bacterium]|nr:hypothetical protein [Candidatus Magasanikbacteria bacterium]